MPGRYLSAQYIIWKHKRAALYSVLTLCQGPCLNGYRASSGRARRLYSTSCTAVIPNSTLVRMCADWVSAAGVHSLSPHHTLPGSSLQHGWASYPPSVPVACSPHGHGPSWSPLLQDQGGQATTSLCCWRVRHVCRSSYCIQSFPTASSRPGHNPWLLVSLSTSWPLSMY